MNVQDQENPDLDLAEVFSEAGSLSRVLADFTPRQEQLDMAETVRDALAQQKHCLAEAGTGVGKSLAYLVPGIAWALRHNSRLVVSTHTKALQTQLIENELPRLVDGGIFARPFRFEICLGVENYVCLLRLLRGAGQEQLPGLDPEYASGLGFLLNWCREPVSGLRLDASHPITDALWRQVCVINDLCPGRQCQYFGECFLQLARQRQREAQVLVTNHHLFFSHLVTDGRILPEFGAAVLDEAHRLEDVATSFLSETVSQAEMQQGLEEVASRKRSSLLAALAQVPKSTLATLGQRAQEHIRKQAQWWQAISARFSAGADTLRVLPNDLTLREPETGPILELARDLSELQSAANTEEESRAVLFLSARLAASASAQLHWYERASQEAVYWAEKQTGWRGENLRLSITPLDLSDRISQLVFESVPTVVLTSATLSVEGQFHYTRARLGVPAALEIVADSPFPYEAHVALYLPSTIPDPQDAEAFEREVQQESLALIRLLDGGVFILHTSYRALRQMADFLRAEEPGREIMVQGTEPVSHLLRRFQHSRKAVILGVETFWQGVDVPGEALRGVFITRLPFNVPTHPLHQARAEYLSAQGENPFHAYSLPRAVLMLRQGFGRLIRRHDDRGLVAILDPRVQTRTWGGVFLDSLPSCARLRDREDVERFINQHFPAIQV